jgi:hypothetical protein
VRVHGVYVYNLFIRGVQLAITKRENIVDTEQEVTETRGEDEEKLTRSRI